MVSYRKTYLIAFVALIVIEGLKKSFGNVEVLKNINLYIKKGKTFGLAGKSGAGKSTLLRCINGLISIDEGTIKVDGVDIKTLSNNQIRVLRKDIGMIFQNFSLLNRLSVYDNVALPLRCWNYKKADIDKKVKELLEVTGIPEKIHSCTHELSGGQKQRVAIARALSMDPKILLCDEATSALDPQTSKSIISLLDKINQDVGITIVVVTHQMPVLRSACEEFAILEEGKIKAVGEVEEIFFKQPAALMNLIGDKELIFSGDGINIELYLNRENIFKPVITEMARELGVDCKIIGGEMTRYRNIPLGTIVINIERKDEGAIKNYLNTHNVRWEEMTDNGNG